MPERDEALTTLESSMEVLAQRVREYYQRVAQTIAPGMLPFTLKVMVIVDRLGPVSVSAVAEQLAADKGQVSRAVSDLEAHGLATRTQDPADARVRLLELTPGAKQRLLAARLPFKQLMREAVAEWQTADIERFAVMVGRVADSVHQR